MHPTNSSQGNGYNRSCINQMEVAFPYFANTGTYLQTDAITVFLKRVLISIKVFQ